MGEAAAASAYPPAPTIGRARARARARAAVGWIGARVRERVEVAGRFARFAGRTAVALRDARTWGPRLAEQGIALGVASIPIGVLLALFTGVVLSLLASYSFTGAIPLYFVGTLVEKTLTMELAPVLTGLALAGRVGANIAAELGTMKVTEQIDALESLAYDPYAFLVVPRVLAGVVMFPVVVALATLVGIAAGWGSAVALLGLSSAEFLKGVRLFYDHFDLSYGLVKSASFGLAVTLLGGLAGLEAAGGAQGVGRAATRAVVGGAVAILVLDAFWAVTWLLGRAR